MEIRTELKRLCAVIALVGYAAACRGDAAQETARAPQAPCPVSSTEGALVNRVRAVYAPIELRLPEGTASRPARDSSQRVHGWTNGAGLAVSYSVQAEAISTSSPMSGDRRVVDCSEYIGGKLANIRLSYSEQTTAPGQYVVATWGLDSGETLTLTATHPDSARRGELLAIVRSVRFLDSVPKS